jgi:serine/threonine-protein kinase
VARALAGRYELEVSLGRGASGEVWRGRDLSTRKPVAVKLVKLAEIEDAALVAETIARFRREAATLARLRHPNIVAALEAGRIDRELFLVMELAEGISLASMLEQRMANNLGLLPVSSMLRIAEQTCAGLAAAHSAGVVHRDIKPSNLMVATRLGIKIIDFGIARLLHDNSPRLTLPRRAMGTLAYISPEQLENIDVDGRADLYSLGCVLYEQLAGHPPFQAEIPSALMQMQMKQRAVPLDAIRSDLPVGLARLVDRLMEKDRSARPEDAAQVLRYIAAISAGADRGRPAQQADRQTVSETVPEQDHVRQEADRQTVVAGETLPKPAARTPEADRSTKPAPALGTAAQAQAGRPSTQRPDGSPPWPQQPTTTTTTTGRRWRPGWRTVASTMITLGIAIGVGAYLGEQAHQSLSVTGVSVSVANPLVGCNATVNVVGTITTNGKGGSITYQWIRTLNGATGPATVTERAGQDAVQVTLTWSFHGTGTTRAIAELRVLSPNSATGNTQFTYSCA